MSVNELRPGERVVRERLGHQRLLVGYRDDDPRRYFLQGDIRGGIEIGNCVDCHHAVYVDSSGVKAYRERDPNVACMYCQDSFRYRERVHQSGLVVQV